jgi:hypothetical protein
MTLQVVGAGLGRTGTHSLKLALETLLDGPCYHMVEVFGHPEHVDVWRRAADGEPVDWPNFPEGYVASVDWPGGSFWREMADANPDAVILLSTRDSSEAWWKSASETIFQAMAPLSDASGWPGMMHAMLANRFTLAVDDRDKAIAAYEHHNADVRANADPKRLVDWKPGDGWEPICAALGVSVPDELFPHVNSTDDFRAMFGLDARRQDA